jgi:hypothetical protein
VAANISPVDLESTSSERLITGRQILDIPYPATRSLKNALRIMPGVLQDRTGTLHFDGGLENQVFYSLNGFNIGDPVTGRFNTRLSVEAVRSLQYSTGRYSPEFGKGSAGALAIETVTGDDKLRYSITNFVPGIDMRKDLHIGTWAPRFGLSGPIRKGRAWFSDNVDLEYNQSVISDLPSGQDRNRTVRGSNLLHGQVNLTPANLLSVDFLGSLESAPRSGLGPLDPVSTTLDRRGRQLFLGFKDQIYFGRGALLELGYARTSTHLLQQPQGSDVYVMTPVGRSGNYFLNATQDSSRHQLLANLFLPAFSFAGHHQLKVGIDLDRLYYAQQGQRTGYENRDLSGRLLTRTVFGGNGTLHLSNTEASWYIVDAWRARSNMMIEYGLRQDWDALVRRPLLSPRLAVSYAPFGWKHTKLAGGYAVVYDASNLALFARPLDQYSLTTFYDAQGLPTRGPGITLFRADRHGLTAPRYHNWSFGVEQELPARFRLGVSLLRRRGEKGFTFLNWSHASDVLPLDTARLYGGTVFDAVYTLQNERRDVYDAAAITLNHSFGREYSWMVNYTRSRALSTAVLDISVDQPLRVIDNFGRLSWDAPNRLLSWGYLPGWGPNWAVSYLLDWRTGFPYSVQHESGEIIGTVNSFRFPVNFDLNLHLERKLRWRHYRFAVRAGFNNVTNHQNPTTVNNVIDSPHYLTYYGSEGRHLVFRLRWLGKE